LGTSATIALALQLVTNAFEPPIRTAPASLGWALPKFVPLIVTEVPAVPELTERLVIAGVGTTVKTVPDGLDVEWLVMITFPVVAPFGTIATTVEELQLVVLAVRPLNLTVPDEPKLYPLIVTLAPTGPEFGVSVVMLGMTVNGFVLLVPFAVCTAT